MNPETLLDCHATLKSQARVSVEFTYYLKTCAGCGVTAEKSSKKMMTEWIGILIGWENCLYRKEECAVGNIMLLHV